MKTLTTKAPRLSTAARNVLRATIVAQAAERHAPYPQYAAHWDGPEWQLVTITKRVKTKLGVAFEPGDVTLARADRGDGYPHPKGWTFLMAYSVRNGIDTSVRVEHTRPLE